MAIESSSFRSQQIYQKRKLFSSSFSLPDCRRTYRMWYQLLEYALVQVTASPLVMAKKAHSTSLPTCCMASGECCWKGNINLKDQAWSRYVALKSLSPLSEPNLDSDLNIAVIHYLNPLRLTYQHTITVSIRSIQGTSEPQTKELSGERCPNMKRGMKPNRLGQGISGNGRVEATIAWPVLGLKLWWMMMDACL